MVVLEEVKTCVTLLAAVVLGIVSVEARPVWKAAGPDGRSVVAKLAAAAEAARTGWPVMRALPFEFPDVPEYDACVTTYMFGPSLLVSAFTKEISIPAGIWYDWRTGEKVVGPCKRPVKISADWGGALYVRAGSVIPMWPKRPHVDKGWNEEVELHVWPGADGTSWLYEDDGTSLAYRAGKGALTPLTLKDGRLTVGPRQGAYNGMPAPRRMKAVFHTPGSTATTERDLGEVGAAGVVAS